MCLILKYQILKLIHLIIYTKYCAPPEIRNRNELNDQPRKCTVTWCVHLSTLLVNTRNVSRRSPLSALSCSVIQCNAGRGVLVLCLTSTVNTVRVDYWGVGVRVDEPSSSVIYWTKYLERKGNV